VRKLDICDLLMCISAAKKKRGVQKKSTMQGKRRTKDPAYSAPTCTVEKKGGTKTTAFRSWEGEVEGERKKKGIGMRNRLWLREKVPKKEEVGEEGELWTRKKTSKPEGTPQQRPLKGRKSRRTNKPSRLIEEGTGKGRSRSGSHRAGKWLINGVMLGTREIYCFLDIVEVHSGGARRGKQKL